MYKAVFELDSWLGLEEVEYEAKSLNKIVDQLQKKQDLYCLVHQAYQYEDDEGILEIKKLENFLNKYNGGTLTLKDFEELDITLSIGSIKCIKIESI